MSARSGLPSVFMAELSNRHVEEYLSRNDLVLVPTGSTEQHGPHAPLSTDVLIPQELCRRIALERDALVAPPINFGISDAHAGFKGLIYLNVGTFMSVVEDVCFSLAEAGFRKIIFVNGHYTNKWAIELACHSVERKLPRGTMATPLTFTSDLPPEPSEEYRGARIGMHAGLRETSLVLAIRPELVDMSRAVRGIPELPEMEGPAFPTVAGYFETGVGRIIRVTETGVYGDPRGASAERGEMYLQKATEGALRALRDVEAMFERFGSAEL
jgi:creatinine amidohydrolase